MTRADTWRPEESVPVTRPLESLQRLTITGLRGEREEWEWQPDCPGGDEGRYVLVER